MDVDKITERVINKLYGNSGNTEETDGWGDEKRGSIANKRGVVTAEKTKITNIHKKNAENAKKRKMEQKEVIVAKINEIRKTLEKVTESISPNIIQEAKFKNFMKTLNEYINMDDMRGAGMGDYGDYVNEEGGDEMLDAEIQEMESEEPGASKFIDQIRKQALEAMSTLSDNSQSPEFQTMNNIFNQCQKYTNDLNKQGQVTEGIFKKKKKNTPSKKVDWEEDDAFYTKHKKYMDDNDLWDKTPGMPPKYK